MPQPNEPIEVTVARLDERFKGFQDAFSEMANDQRRLTNSYEKLVESNQRIGLIESDIVNIKDSQSKLWLKFEDQEKMRNHITGNALYDIVKMIIAIIAGAILAKYGMTMP